MHNSSVTGANNILMIEDDELRFELSDDVNGSLDGGEDESDENVLVFHSSKSDSNVISTHCDRYFVLHFVVDRSDDDGSLRWRCQISNREGERGTANLVRHEKQSISFLNSSTLDLSNDDSSHIGVLLRDRHHERSVVLSIHQRHVVQEIEQRRSSEIEESAMQRCWMGGNGSLDPGSDCAIDRILQIRTGVSRDRNKDDVGFEVESSSSQEGRKLAVNLVVSALEHQ